MDANLNFVMQKRLEHAKAMLDKNNMKTQIVQTATEVVPALTQMLAENSVVACGGSMTLEACGVMDYLRQGNYRFLDRDAPGVDKRQIFINSFSADFYLSSANAITQNGEIYEIDGNGNRVAALAYGPGKVVIVAGRNKIVPDLAAARQRRMETASPANALRVGAGTPCTITGRCSDCKSPGRICCTETILLYQRNAERIRVILVNEDLGY